MSCNQIGNSLLLQEMSCNDNLILREVSNNQRRRLGMSLGRLGMARAKNAIVKSSTFTSLNIDWRLYGISKRELMKVP